MFGLDQVFINKSSAIYNAIHLKDFSGLDDETNYSDQGLIKLCAELNYSAEMKPLRELETELSYIFGDAWDDCENYTIQTYDGEIDLTFTTSKWYWWSDSWEGAPSDYLAKRIGVSPGLVSGVIEEY